MKSQETVWKVVDSVDSWPRVDYWDCGKRTQDRTERSGFEPHSVTHLLLEHL